VTRILTVGWRGQEETFLSLAKESGLRDQLRGLIVSRGAPDALAVARHLGTKFNSAELKASDARGFSDFIRRGIEQIAAFG
jgi:hypothetical protein